MSKIIYPENYDYNNFEIIDNDISHINLGLCCINTELRKKDIFPNRTCRLKTAQEKGLDYIKSLVIKNLQDVLTILEWNKENKIYSYRLSSDMFPHVNNTKFHNPTDITEPTYSLDFSKELLHKIGKKAFDYGIRLSFHPGQYNQIGTPNQKVFENTVRDLSVHCKILDIIEENIDIGKNRAIICIHGGGVYKEKEKTIERWIKQYKTLPNNLKKRLCIENCERCYSVEDCLYICKNTGLSLIFDVHHYNCTSQIYPELKQKTPKELLPLILQTWKNRGLKPYFHISEQGSGRIGHHSDYIETIPHYLLELDCNITLDIEAKAKEKAILKLFKKYLLK
tara:strand:- start:89 stop:1102 length:1014 start_codon:yes stop_codon:yes gene_type:complete